MKELTVKYLISDDKYKELEEITGLYNKGAEKESTPENLFEIIMLVGCMYEINAKLDYAKRSLLANQQKEGKG